LQANQDKQVSLHIGKKCKLAGYFISRRVLAAQSGCLSLRVGSCGDSNKPVPDCDSLDGAAFDAVGKTFELHLRVLRDLRGDIPGPDSTVKAFSFSIHLISPTSAAIQGQTSFPTAASPSKRFGSTRADKTCFLLEFMKAVLNP
jgi:hypothetical protein